MCRVGHYRESTLPEIGGQWLEFLKEIAPGLNQVAGILDPGFKGFAGVWGAIENMAPRLEIEVKNLPFQASTAISNLPLPDLRKSREER
jgi:hypothetical protein